MCKGKQLQLSCPPESMTRTRQAVERFHLFVLNSKRRIFAFSWTKAKDLVEQIFSCYYMKRVSKVAILCH